MGRIIHWYNLRAMENLLGHQISGYKVQTPVYEGPLDLLLSLIERAELNITAISLASVTDQTGMAVGDWLRGEFKGLGFRVSSFGFPVSG